MILIIDNTKNLTKAYMTPKIIDILKKQKIKYLIISDIEELNSILISKNKKKKIKGIILSGGPLCLSEELSIKSINKNIIALLNFSDIPILGICFGFQIMAASYGGLIEPMDIPEEGIYSINIDNTNPLFNGLNKTIKVFQSHNDKLVKIPPLFDVIAKSKTKKIIYGIYSKEKKRYGVQFHPEGLEETKIIINNFINICYKLQ